MSHTTARLTSFLCVLLLVHPCLVNSSNILNQKSFGILAPYIYARQKILGDTSMWANNLYDTYLKKYYSQSAPIKQKFDSAIENFRTSHSIDSQLDVIHTQSLLLLDHKSKTSHDMSTVTQCAESLSDSLPTDVLDAMAYEYTKLKPNTFIATIFPIEHRQFKKITAQLHMHFDIVFSKKITIKHSQASIFIQTLYDGEKWLGDSSNRFSGAQEKAHLCYPVSTKNSPTYIILFESDSLDKVIQIKKQIRQSLKHHQHSLHINDTHSETIRIAQMVFNENSLHFINHAKQEKYINFEKYFHDYKNILLHSKINPETLCIDSSAILSCYGLRDCKDLDFLYHSQAALMKKLCSKDINSHNQEAKHYPVSIDTILFNPKYHFYYKGVKLASLDIVRKMKEHRNEKKDRRDITLIQSLLN